MVEPGLYQHYKGNFYEVMGFGLHSETNEELVLYRLAEGGSAAQGRIWARPLEMFQGNLKDGRKRFTLLAKEGPCIKGCGRAGTLVRGLCGVCQLIEAQKRGERPLEEA